MKHILLLSWFKLFLNVLGDSHELPRRGVCPPPYPPPLTPYPPVKDTPVSSHGKYFPGIQIRPIYLQESVLLETDSYKNARNSKC